MNIAKRLQRILFLSKELDSRIISSSSSIIDLILTYLWENLVAPTIQGRNFYKIVFHSSISINSTIELNA